MPVWAAMLLLCAPLAGQASTFRYALVIGSNGGETARSQSRSTAHSEIPPLLHAEREAHRLGKALVRLAAFPSSNVEVLRSPRHHEVMEAVSRLSRRAQRDLQHVRGAKILFGLFFTGHGRPGELLLADGETLSAHDIESILRRMNPDFTVGFFDACYSGSLDVASLRSKGGILPTRGVNVFDRLPDQLLNAAGAMWFTSSGADELSFEDQRLGGVFTHFFIEALSRARRVGPAVPLDGIYEYANRHTVRYTAARARRQTPRMVAHVAGQSFPLFSFPVQRSASLTLAEPLEGRFVLTWGDGSLSQVVDKPGGKALELKLFPGRVELQQLRPDTDPVRIALDLGSSPVEVTDGSLRQAATLGRDYRGLRSKSGDLAAWVPHAETTVLLGAGYGFTPLVQGVLAPEHRLMSAIRIDYGAFTGSATLGWGMSERRYDAWAFDAHGGVMELAGGVAWDLPLRSRLNLDLQVGGGLVQQRFSDGSARLAGFVDPGLGLSWLVGLSSATALEIRASGGARWGALVAAAAGHGWSAFGGIDLRLWFGPL